MGDAGQMRNAALRHVKIIDELGGFVPSLRSPD
jgi:hypothetical protein